MRISGLVACRWWRDCSHGDVCLAIFGAEFPPLVGSIQHPRRNATCACCMADHDVTWPRQWQRYAVTSASRQVPSSYITERFVRPLENTILSHCRKRTPPFPCLGVLYGPLLYMSDHNSQFPVPQLAPDLQFAVDVGHINYHQVSPGPESQSVNNIADAV